MMIQLTKMNKNQNRRAILLLFGLLFFCNLHTNFFQNFLVFRALVVIVLYLVSFLSFINSLIFLRTHFTKFGSIR